MTPSPGMDLRLHAEVMAIMLGMQAPFHERVFLEEDGETVAGGQEPFWRRAASLSSPPRRRRRGVFARDR